MSSKCVRAGVTHVRDILRCEGGQLRWARDGELGPRRGAAPMAAERYAELLA